MLVIENIQKQYEGVNLFKPINFTLNKAESLSISGPNGTGKTTLLLMIMGYTKPSKGSIFWSVNNQKMPVLFSDIAFAGVQMNLFEDLSVADHFSYHFKFRTPIVSGYNTILKTYFEPYMMKKQIKQLSAGWYNRVKLLTALLTQSRILLLDEPFSNLDNQGIELLSNAIQELKKDRQLLIAGNREEELSLCKQSLMLERN